MNKAAAKTLSLSGTLTWGDLKSAVSEMRQRGGMSKLNPSLTLKQVCDIYEGVFTEHADSDVVSGMIYSPMRNKYVMSRDAIVAMNILRDAKSVKVVSEETR